MLSEAPLESLQPATLEARRNVQGLSEERLGIRVGFDLGDRRQTQVGSRARTSCDLPDVVLISQASVIRTGTTATAGSPWLT